MKVKKTTPQGAGSGSFGFSGSAYNQVIVFQKEEHFNLTLEANPHMEPIMGALPEDKVNFPGVYIAGIKANSQRDKSGDHRAATQK